MTFFDRDDWPLILIFVFLGMAISGGIFVEAYKTVRPMSDVQTCLSGIPLSASAAERVVQTKACEVYKK